MGNEGLIVERAFESVSRVPEITPNGDARGGEG